MTAPDQGGVLFGPFTGAAETETAPGQAARDHQAEQDDAELAAWREANNYPDDGTAVADEMGYAFLEGMQAARDLAAVTGDGSLRARITALAEAWEGNPKLTEEGQLLRDLGQVLRDELAYSSDRPAAAAARERPAPGDVIERLAAAIGRRQILVKVGSGTELRRVARPRDLAVQLLTDVDRRLTDDPQPAPELAAAMAERDEARADVEMLKSRLDQAEAAEDELRALISEMGDEWQRIGTNHDDDEFIAGIRQRAGLEGK